MNQESSVDRDLAYQALVAQVQARRALEAEAIAEGKSDIVSDETMTPAERRAMGLDRYVGDGLDEEDGEPAVRALETADHS